MDILQQSDSYFTVMKDGKECFLFRTFATADVGILTNYFEYNNFHGKIDKYFVEEKPLTADERLDCICVEPISFNESMTITEWSSAFKLIYNKFKADYTKVYFKLMVIGNKFAYVASKADMHYVASIYMDYFDEESGMKNQEYIIYTI